MPRQKVPVRATFREVAYSPNHEFPFHFVGMIEDEKRYVISGMTQEQAELVYEKLGKALGQNGDSETEAQA